MGVKKKTYIKLKFFPTRMGSDLYTNPASATTLNDLGGASGVDWDPSTFTMTAGGSGVKDFTTLFNVGGLVINAVFNERWATVVSVTATEVVFDGDLSGYNGGKFMESYFIQWTDPAEAFTLVLDDKQILDPSPYIEVNCWYPGDAIFTACTHPAKIVGRDGHTLTLDRPLPFSYANDYMPMLWDGAYSGATTDSLVSVAFWGGTDYWYDTWFDFSSASNTTDIGWLEYWDSYAASNSNQTEEQLYAKIDKQVADFARVLDAAYPETDWYVGTPRLGEYFF